MILKCITKIKTYMNWFKKKKKHIYDGTYDDECVREELTWGRVGNLTGQGNSVKIDNRRLASRYGQELIEPNGWTIPTGSGWSNDDGILNNDGTIVNKSIEQEVLVVGKTYRLEFRLNVNSGSLTARARARGGNQSQALITPITVGGSYFHEFVAEYTGLHFLPLSTNTADFTIRDISLREIKIN
jgi:hypothetical protein